MIDAPIMSLPEAARSLDLSIRALRRAIRAGVVPAPPSLTATAPVPAKWVEQVRAAMILSPDARAWSPPSKVPPFARYPGTSAWRKYRGRVREYARFQASVHPTPVVVVPVTSG